MDHSLTESDVALVIKSNNPNCRFKVKAYSYVDQFSEIDSLMRDLDALVLLYQTSPMYGHWVVLTKCDTKEYKDYIKERWGKSTTLPVYCFFDSYGCMIDHELSFVPEKMKGILGEEFPALRTMLNNCPNVVEWNTHHLQSDTANTCGRWASLRAAEYTEPLEKWVLQFKTKSPDQVILKLTDMSFSGGTLCGGKRKRKGRKSKRKLGSHGNVVQTVKISIGAKPIAEQPIEMDDYRLVYKNPFAAPKPKYSQPQMQERVQVVPQFQTTHLVEHNSNGMTCANLALIGAMNQLSMKMSSLKQGQTYYDAQRQHEAKFISQSNSIGGASDQVADLPQIEDGQSRQQRLNAQTQTINVARPQIRSGVDRVVASQLESQEKQMESTDGVQAAEEIPISIYPNVTQEPTGDVSTTVEIRNPRQRQLVEVLSRPAVTTSGIPMTIPTSFQFGPRQTGLLSAFRPIGPSVGITRQERFERSMSRAASEAPNDLELYRRGRRRFGAEHGDSPTTLEASLAKATPSVLDNPYNRQFVEEERDIRRKQYAGRTRESIERETLRDLGEVPMYAEASGLRKIKHSKLRR